ncbi:hypothetical protein [Rhodanobacter thiooxydans]|uniref:hypothetical protein n=1 Tax=Rhodanobacter thiooxydans TaxID=416169 RepID=UPI000260D599|nr:hypothetical protein [Rhodanobacter thiooxydans]EIM03325.1 hypothetical protein UUA_00220 [Rhodanobacter thiooxydans LCS2]
MKVDNLLPPPKAENLQTQAQRCKDALLGLQPKIQHQKNQLFTMLYPVIVELLEKRVSQKDILAVLQAQGLKLHPSRFKALMTAHAACADHSLTSATGTDTDEVQA